MGRNAPKRRSTESPLAAAENVTPPPKDRFGLAVGGLLLLAVVLVFGQTVDYGFLNFDDDEYIHKNPEVSAGLTWHGIQWAFTTRHSCNWHPITWLSHMLDSSIYGRHAGGHHLTSVLLHAANAILLFLVLRRMTGARWPSAFVAAVFALHPLRVESVAWAAERKDVLSGLFFMLTLAAYVAYVRRPFSIVRYLAVVASFALGLMAKPMLVTLPFVLLLLDYWPLGRTALGEHGNEGQGPASRQSWLRLIVEKLPLLALSAASCGATLWAQRKAIAFNERIDFLTRLANAAVSSVDYLAQLFHPVNLALVYPHPGFALPAWRVAAATLVLAAISVAVSIGWRRYPFLLVGWLWYLGMLVPVIGLVQVGGQAMADRYTYLPQIGLCIGLAWSAAWLAASSSWPRRRLLCGGVAALIVLDLMVCAAQQTWYWRDSKTLWTHALNCTERNAVAHHGLGLALSEVGQDDDAIAELEKAVKIRPHSTEFRYNLASLLKRRGRTDAAIEQYREAANSRPDLAEAHYHLGILLAERGKIDEAVAELRNALEYKLKSKSDEANAYYNLAVCLGDQGKTADAMACWREALRLEPNDADTVDRVAWRLATCPDPSIRNGNEAIELAQRAVQLSNGKDPVRLGTLAAAYAEVGRFAEAVETAQRALAIAVQRGDSASVGELRAQTELYRAHRPYHEPPGQPR